MKRVDDVVTTRTRSSDRDGARVDGWAWRVASGHTVRDISPMQPRLVVRRTAAALGILGPVFALYRWVRESSPKLLIANLRSRRAARFEGLPVPPGRLLYLASTTRDVPHFLQSGRAASDALRTALLRVGKPIESAHDILDFGCGCGRVLRQWANLGETRVHGSDYNPKGVNWVRANLPWVDARVNGLAPPLAFTEASFDFVYALSVFTHLPVGLQADWIDELHRVLRPGGILAISTMGDAYTHRLSPDEGRRFANGEIITRDDSYAGTNLCAAYHSEAAVYKWLARGFRVVDFQASGARGNVKQDQYLLLRVP